MKLYFSAAVLPHSQPSHVYNYGALYNVNHLDNSVSICSPFYCKLFCFVFISFSKNTKNGMSQSNVIPKNMCKLL